MKRFLRLCAVAILLVGGVQRAEAQHVALKKNLLYDATGTINLGTEIALAPRWTLDWSSSLNDWEVLENREWKHFLTQPEARYWFCSRFAGHFIGIHAHYARYDIANIDNDIKFLGTNFSALSNSGFNGWLLGAGVGYGYAFVLGEHWNLEMELGIGYAYMEYDRRVWATGVVVEHNAHRNYFGITKLNIGLSYIF
jgi:hypothetical protein